MMVEKTVGHFLFLLGHLVLSGFDIVDTMVWCFLWAQVWVGKLRDSACQLQHLG
jgi:hypothetical protein